ncbi:unnamed protein product, partial [Pylaiella littoralis]
GDSETGSQAGDSAQSSRKPLTFVSVPDKFRATFNSLLHQAPSCKQIRQLDGQRKLDLLHEIRVLVSELLRLAQLDPDLHEERTFVANLQAGLEHCMMAGRADAVAIYVHNRLMSSSEESRQVDMGQITLEVADIKKFLGSSQPDVRAAITWRCAAMPPMMLAPQFHAAGGPQQQQQWSAPPAFHPGMGPPQQQQQRIRSSRPRRSPVCGNCKRAKRPDVNHSHDRCPFVICRKSQASGHIERHCRN